MAKDTPKAKASSGTDKPIDPEVARLQKETARLLARRELADAKHSTLVGLAPGVTDAPKNMVTLEDKAGSLAPWLTNSVLASVAQAIATGVWELVPSQPLAPTVIFVTDDAALLASDVVSRQVNAAMKGRTQELTVVAGQLAGAFEALEQAIKNYKEAEQSHRDDQGDQRQPRWALVAEAEAAAAAAAQDAKTVQAAAEATVEGAGGEGEPKEEGGPEDAGASSGPIGAAIDLVRLLATDYTITAAEVSVSSGVLARLTAGSIANRKSGDSIANRKIDGEIRALIESGDSIANRKSGDSIANRKSGDKQAQVLLDGFSLAKGSATLKAYDKLIASANKVIAGAQALSAKAAPVAAEADAYRSAVERAREGWEKAAVDEKASPGSADELKDALDELTGRMNRRLSAAAAAQDMAEDGESVVATARVELAALATADGTGISPLQRACSRDRLHDTNAPVTHVLLVEASHAGADIVTRRSILGSSGRVGYLGGANAAWVMIDADTGAVAGGASVDKASQMTHDMASGESRKTDITDNQNLSKTDPLEKNEQWLRIGVLILALALVLLSIAATLAVLFPDINFG